GWAFLSRTGPGFEPHAHSKKRVDPAGHLDLRSCADRFLRFSDRLRHVRILDFLRTRHRFALHLSPKTPQCRPPLSRSGLSGRAHYRAGARLVSDHQYNMDSAAAIRDRTGLYCDRTPFLLLLVAKTKGLAGIDSKAQC